MPNRLRIFLSVVILILIGFVAGYFFDDYSDNLKKEKGTIQVRSSSSSSSSSSSMKYEFINPLYECEVDGEEFLKKYVPFENKIKERIANEIINDENGHLSIYFRNLNNGPWFGINEDENFAPASLLKVPLMMAYFKKAESDPNILNVELRFQKAAEDNLTAMQQVIPTIRLDEGESYSVEELIRRMIVYSDNEAMALLFNNFSKEDLGSIYGDLGVSNPFGGGSADVLSVKEYASFFRLLYNASYLDMNKSEKALALLTDSDFKDGIVSGVSEGVKVSHKFGERELAEGEFKQQFHDCGIVYYEKYPYLLCVMTRGENKNELINIIKDTSRIVFEEVSRSYP